MLMGGTGGWGGVWANCRVLGVWEGSFTVSGPPVSLLYVHSFFGRAFEKAAEGTNSRTLHNYFDFSGKSLLHWGPFKVVAGLGTGEAGYPANRPLFFLEPALCLNSGSSAMPWAPHSCLGPDRLPDQPLEAGSGVAQASIGLALSL